MLLELLAILRAPWLRAALIWWRGRWFGRKGSRSRRQSGHVGCGRRRRMGWVGITCLDRRGRGAWRRVIGEEAAALQARSEGFNLERKVETGEMWLLVRGRGGRYFRGSQKFGIASAKKLARKVSLDTVPYSDTVRRYFVLHLTRLVIINCVGSTWFFVLIWIT